nr:UvrD-helicase domain-containing protein [Clostridia bacterium]
MERHNPINSNKAEEIQSYFCANYSDNGSPLLLDDEQARAVAADSKNVLVRARAGSGKTRVIASKILYLLDHEKESEGSILTLSFNRGVKDEISERINHDIRKNFQEKDRLLQISKTFHSLAYSCAPGHEIITDNDRSFFIKDMIEVFKERDPNYKKTVYENFRRESFQVDGRKFKDEKSYYSFLRNLTFTTLRNEHVKSLGEKWIADFLYEHGVNYVYEYKFYPTYITPNSLNCDESKKERIKAFLNENYRITDSGNLKRDLIVPDFYLPDYHLVLEHWGIDESNTSPEAKNDFSQLFEMSWDQYHRNMDWKRKFWHGWRKTIRKSNRYLSDIVNVKGLLETSVTDLRNGREEFEKHLERLLIQNGVTVKEPDESKLIEEVWERQLPRFVSMMTSFVDKFEQHYASQDVDEFESFAQSFFSGEYNDEDNDRAYAFSYLGLKFLRQYFSILTRPSKPEEFKKYDRFDCDFNMLLHYATEEIRSGTRDEHISAYKHILIDEYQDFSELFFQFIKAINERNHKVKMFCVGDDWQAINSFMGADTHYFEFFSDFFENASEITISTNYRSTKSIVDFSSSFMRINDFAGSPAKARNSNNTLPVIKNMDDVFVELREDKKDTEDFKEDNIYRKALGESAGKNTLLVRYLKYCCQEIEEGFKRGEKEILLLSRTGKFLGQYNLEEFERTIQKILRSKGYPGELSRGIHAMTMHKSKGQQADTVFLLECNRSKMPLIHPDNELYEVFGDTPEDILRDEMRLFYVAVTRAKTHLYMLYDGDRVSEFVRQYAAIAGINPQAAY